MSGCKSRPVDGSLAGSGPIHPSPDCAPSADDDARIHRRLSRRWRSPRPPRFEPGTTTRILSRLQQTRLSTNTWCRFVRSTATEMSVEVASLGRAGAWRHGLQCGSPGAAQYLRDSRIPADRTRQRPRFSQRPRRRKNAARRRAHARRRLAAQLLRRAELASTISQPPKAWPSASMRPRGLRAGRRLRAGNTKAIRMRCFAGSVPYLMLSGNVMAAGSGSACADPRRRAAREGRGRCAFLKARSRPRIFMPPFAEQGPGGARRDRRWCLNRCALSSIRSELESTTHAPPGVLAKLAPCRSSALPLFIISNPSS